MTVLKYHCVMFAINGYITFDTHKYIDQGTNSKSVTRRTFKDSVFGS